MIRPPDVVLNGVDFQLFENPDVLPYREYTEPAVQQQADIAGASRPSKNARPDTMVWRMDSWSGGEGQKFVDTARDDSFSQYFYSDEAIDVITNPGEVSLGLKLTDDTAGVGVTTHGPYLAVTNGFLAAIATDSGVSQRNRRKNLSTGVWSALASTLVSTALASGQASSGGNFVYEGYRGAGAVIRRYDPSANAEVTFLAVAAENVLVADNRLYFLFDTAAGSMELRRSPFTTPASSTVYTVDGVGGQAGIESLGAKIFIASQGNDEEPRIHLYDGSVGSERVRCPIGFRVTTSPIFNAMAMLGDLLFVAGFKDGSAGEPTRPMLVYVSGARTGTVGIVRDDVDTTEEKFNTCAPGFGNRVIMGTNLGRVFAYDINQGGLSQLFTGLPSTAGIRSIAYAKGRYYVGALDSGTGKVFASQATGTNKHPSTAKIFSSIWDFNYSEELKIITSIEVFTKPLPGATTAVDLELVLDDGTTVTTDAAGASLRHTGASMTRTKFTISDADTTRTCRVLQVNATLRNDVGAGDSSVTPRVYSVVVTAEGLGGQDFFELALSLEDKTSTERALNTSPAGLVYAEGLRTLRSLARGQLVTFTPNFISGNRDIYPQGGQSQSVVKVVDIDIRLSDPGNGYARVVLKKIG